MNPYLGMIRDNIKSGKQLEALDDESLKKIGISAFGARKTILQAVSLLLYFVSSLWNIDAFFIKKRFHRVKSIQTA